MEAHAYFFKSPGRTKTPCIHHLGKPVAACAVGIYYRRLLPCLIPVSALYFTVPPDADEGMDIMANVKDPKAVPHRNIGWQCGLERGRANGAAKSRLGRKSFAGPSEDCDNQKMGKCLSSQTAKERPAERGTLDFNNQDYLAILRQNQERAPDLPILIVPGSVSELHTAPSKMPDSGDQTSGSGGSSPADSTGSQEETQRGRSRTGYN
ncbi:uncharacterized protein PG998_011284 [Apiospora kogelbergensis]|uniref:uncharacterized protein n=1 Tax=Apiospora kogelbergensis TaxID=1337665 RepID=UPI00312CE882